MNKKSSLSCIWKLIFIVNIVIGPKVFGRTHNKIVASDDEVLQPLFETDLATSELEKDYSIPKASKSKRLRSKRSLKQKDIDPQEFDEKLLLKCAIDLPSYKQIQTSSANSARASTADNADTQTPIKISLDLPSIQSSHIKAIPGQQLYNLNTEKKSNAVNLNVMNQKTQERLSFNLPFDNVNPEDIEVVIFKPSNTTKAAPGTVITSRKSVPAPGTVIATTKDKATVPQNVPLNSIAEIPFTPSSDEIQIPIFSSNSSLITKEDENRIPAACNGTIANKPVDVPPTVPKPRKIKILEESTIVSLEFNQSYTGPRIDMETEITTEFVSKILIPYFKSGKVLDRKSSFTLLLRAYQEFLVEEALQEIELGNDENIIIFGDIHGQFPDFIRVIEKEGPPSSKLKYIFNGDIVDRGAYSIECLMTLLAFKIAEPDNFFITLGNHETASVGKLQFHKESVKKYGNEEFFRLSHQLFRSFPPAYLIQKEVFVTHGGITSDLTLDRIRQIDRIEPDVEDEDVINDLIWSDPVNTNGTTVSHRGLGYLFGPDVTHEFVVENNISVIIRSHQYKEFGFSEQHDGLCITIFSCPNYRGKMPNYGAYIKIDRQLNLTYHIFKAVENNSKKDYPSIPSDLKFSRNVLRVRN